MRALPWKGKGLFQLTVAVGHPEKSGQESNHKHGGHGEVMLAGLPQDLLSLLPTQLRIRCPGITPPTVGWTLPISH